MEEINSVIFGVWFLIGAALVFWMQAGFAMVEAGFTRAKNTGNIIMKNLMDFCIGCCVFVPIGFGIMLGENALGGFIGIPNWDIFTNYGDFPWSSFIFNLVFCATTSTIVSGAMAERTKFLSYCVYSAVISAVIYPIEAHWVWGNGWLAQLGFHDFAGSNCIHMVGGISALIGAAILGPRIGKFSKKKDGSIEVHAFPGHNLALGALGVFILWLGWYGFNGAACTSLEQLGSVFVTTTIAPSVATLVCMIFTWIRYGKPDVSMCLNASLAGLVAITAPCDSADALGSIIIGAVSGVLVVFGVWLCDYILHVDDPVGAVAVHMMNGIWGTIAVGLFSNPVVPGYSIQDAAGNQMAGLFYGGGFKLLGLQLLGMGATAAWTAVTITLTFLGIRKAIGLRCTREEEIIGLDKTEHGLENAYADFMPLTHVTGTIGDLPTVTGPVPMDAAIPVELHTEPVELSESAEVIHPEGKITKLEILIKQERLAALKDALMELGVTGMTVTNCMGFGTQKGHPEYYRGVRREANLLPRLQVEVVVSTVPVRSVIETAKKVLYTGHYGDGKIFLYNVENVVKIRTGEEGLSALVDEEQY